MYIILKIYVIMFKHLNTNLSEILDVTLDTRGCGKTTVNIKGSTLVMYGHFSESSNASSSQKSLDCPLLQKKCAI